MASTKRSLRAQVVNWLLLLFAILLVISFAVSYIASVDFANLPYDRQLLATARTLGEQVIAERGELRLVLPDTVKKPLLHDDVDQIYFKISAPDGHLLGGDPILPTIANEDNQPPPELMTTDIAGMPMRLVNLQVRISIEGGEATAITVQVAESLNKRTRLAREIFFKLLIPQIMLAALPIGGLWLGVGSGLAPLDRLKKALTARSQHDLSSVGIEDDTPDEVRPLIEAFNEILARMRNLMDSQQRFVADAAHQLRTPLAGLKTQAELALRLKDPQGIQDALRQILVSVERGSNLVNQLLTLARHEQGQIVLKPVDLNTIVQNAAMQYVEQAMSKRIDLGFEPCTQAVFVLGESISLQEMVGNLIDNAVRYTQERSRITARVSTQDDAGIVTVEDNGPGIQPADRSRVFERFYRGLGTNQEGSGLGLAIVQEIARLHHAEVSVTEGAGGKGTVFKISVPLSDEPNLVRQPHETGLSNSHGFFPDSSPARARSRS